TATGSAGTPAAVRAVRGIDALIALQGVEDATERRRGAVKCGRIALDALEEPQDWPPRRDPGACDSQSVAFCRNRSQEWVGGGRPRRRAGSKSNSVSRSKSPRWRAAGRRKSVASARRRQRAPRALWVPRHDGGCGIHSVIVATRPSLYKRGASRGFASAL